MIPECDADDNDAVAEELLRYLVTHRLKPVDTDSMYDDMLDECYSLKIVGGPFACMSASRVLKECDPIAYRVGFSDYIDSCDDLIEVCGSYYRTSDIDTLKEELVDALNECSLS